MSALRRGSAATRQAPPRGATHLVRGRDDRPRGGGTASEQENREDPDVRARVDVPGIGQYTEAVGAALPAAGAVSAPVKTQEGVYVLRVDKRVVSDSTAWGAQKDAQKTGRLQQLRQQKIQMFLQDLRKAAKVDDRRKQINAATRRAEV